MSFTRRDFSKHCSDEEKQAIEEITSHFLKHYNYEGVDVITSDGFVPFKKLIHDLMEFLDQHNGDLSAVNLNLAHQRP